MKSGLCICLLAGWLLLAVGPAGASSPFGPGAPAPPPEPAPAMGVLQTVLVKINLWQRQLNGRITVLGREVRATGSPRPLLMLLALAFAYGLLHAAGPGHGKAVTLAYVLTRGRLTAGLVMGNLVALAHGLSGVLLVLVVRLILEGSLRGALAQVTHYTQLISYGLIALLGAVLLAGRLWTWRGAGPQQPPRADVPPWLIALAAGAVPCPGVVLIMLFCLSLGMTWLGLLLAGVMTLGMALTISAVGCLAHAGKGLSLRLGAGRPGAARVVERTWETLAALAVLVLGLLLLGSALVSPPLN